VEAKSSKALAYARGEAEGFTYRIALLEGEHAKECQARDMTEENSWGLSDMMADVEWLWEESMREC
jgi:hypothetical protein